MSALNGATIVPAKETKITVTSAMKAMFHAPVTHTARSARSGARAPRFCPTSVAAAFATPQAGRMMKMTMRIAITYPASTTLPKVARIRMSPT